jgi:nucleoside-diphosphate-sugar epimerase
MKIFVAGASGAIGKRLTPLLVADGHNVFATTRTESKTGEIRAEGAEAIVMDGLNKDDVVRAVMSCRPDVIVHEMTAIALRNLQDFDHEFTTTNQLRTRGTENLLDAARAAGTRMFVAQSFAGWPAIREGGRIKTEQDAFDPHPPKAMTETLGAIRRLESLVTSASEIQGIVLRYGSLYGPGTSIAPNGDVVQLVRKRGLPVVGNGAGVWSFLHVDDAANATRLAIERDKPGIYNIVDDEPAEVSLWLPHLAEALGAKPPRHVPVWLARWVIGDSGVMMMTTARGSSNAKAKRELGWEPQWASWREGFRNGLTSEPQAWRAFLRHEVSKD